MTDWFDRLARLAALGERVSTLTEGVSALAKRAEDHKSRLVRLETIVEIVRPDGAALRVAVKPGADRVE